MLLVVPGIIAFLRYSMTFYILADNPGMSGFSAIKKSKEMMKGHKKELFILCLSFIPWGLLCIAIMCIIAVAMETLKLSIIAPFLLCITVIGMGGFICLYFITTTANFYENLKKESVKEEKASN